MEPGSFTDISFVISSRMTEAEHDDHEAVVAIEARSGARTDVARFVRAGDDVVWNPKG